MMPTYSIVWVSYVALHLCSILVFSANRLCYWDLKILERVCSSLKWVRLLHHLLMTFHTDSEIYSAFPTLIKKKLTFRIAM